MTERWYPEFVQILRDEYGAASARNPRYSKRAFAARLGISPASLTAIFSGKTEWKIGAERAVEIVGGLSVSSDRKNKLLVSLGADPEFNRKALKTSDYDILTDWTYYPILVAFDLPREFRTVTAIAERLCVPPGKVESVIADLVKRGLLVTNAAGEIVRPVDYISTSDGPPNAVIREYHRLNLETSLRALKEIPAEQRDFTAFTFAGTASELVELKKEIRKLCEKANSLASAIGSKDTVLRLSVQLFPVDFRSGK